jgi:hypothetical protein
MGRAFAVKRDELIYNVLMEAEGSPPVYNQPANSAGALTAKDMTDLMDKWQKEIPEPPPIIVPPSKLTDGKVFVISNPPGVFDWMQPYEMKTYAAKIQIAQSSPCCRCGVLVEGGEHAKPEYCIQALKDQRDAANEQLYIQKKISNIEREVSRMEAKADPGSKGPTENAATQKRRKIRLADE